MSYNVIQNVGQYLLITCRTKLYRTSL